MIKLAIVNPIGFWDADTEWLARNLEEAGGADIEISLSSPGGVVNEGLAMSNLIKNYSGNVTFRIIGMAASMASYFALSGKTLPVVEDNAIFMIHNATSFIDGDHVALEKRAKLLKSVSGLLARRYAEKSGKTISEIRDLMTAETYYFGKEIKTAGFASEVIKSNKKETKEDAVAFAQLAVEDVFSKMKTEEKAKDDLERAAAYLKIEPVTAEIKKETTPAMGREKIIKTEDAMDIAKLKAEHPALYNEILQAGVVEGIENERKRVTAHITIAEPAKAHDEMIKFIKSGASVQDDTVHAEYMAAGLKNQSIDQRLEDEPGEIEIEKEEGNDVQMKAFEDTLKNEMGGVQ